MTDMSHKVSSDLFLGFGSVPLPDAIEAFRFRVGEQENPTGFERYAARVFGEINLDRLRTVADEREISLAHIARMDAFYINFSRAGMSPEDIQLVYQVETVLNRLTGVMKEVGDSSPTEEACSLADIRAFQSVTESVARLIEHAGETNPWQRPGSIRCQPGGEWDARTRLGFMCEGLSTITRLDYSFRCDTVTGDIAMAFETPGELSMPHSAFDEDLGTWRDVNGEERFALASEHASRIALVLGAAAFSAGMRIRRCSVTAKRGDREEALFCLAFERGQFLTTFIPLAKSLLHSPLASGRCGRALRAFEGRPVIDSSLPDARWRKPCEDDRPLPDALRSLLLADSACELEVMEPDDSPAMRRFNSLRVPIAMNAPDAGSRLKALVGDLEAECALVELQSDCPLDSQFCENYLSRLILPLLAERSDIRINRASDALYFAQYELSNWYLRSGRYDLALDEARHLLDMATSSSQAHYNLINILARMERFQDLIEVCRHGLRLAYDRSTAAYYYYRMAFAYWALGNRELAFACYALIPAGEQVSHVAQVEMGTLLSEMERRDRPSPEEAAATVRGAGISLAPSDEVSNRIADLAVLLTDQGFFALAQVCINYMWNAMGSDELGAVARSLQPQGIRRGRDASSDR